MSDVDAENIKQTYWNIVNNGKHLFGDKVYFQTALVNDNIIIEGNAQSEERSKNGWHTAFLTFDISAEYHKNYLSLKNT